jgi:hypothetical protein
LYKLLFLFFSPFFLHYWSDVLLARLPLLFPNKNQQLAVFFSRNIYSTFQVQVTCKDARQ